MLHVIQILGQFFLIKFSSSKLTTVEQLLEMDRSATSTKRKTREKSMAKQRTQ